MKGPCIVTGTSGFVGSRLKQRLQAAGWEVRTWNRKPAEGAEHFELGEEVEPERLKGAQALVHCAYDFEPLRWKDIFEKNVIGSKKLFEAAREAGVERMVFISSLSAFAGCRSLYGRAKLAIEKIVEPSGVFVLRPGLIYGDAPEGMFGRLVKQVSRGGLVPIVSGGNQAQYLIHEEDLANLAVGCLQGDVPGRIGPIPAAHPRSWQLPEILRRIAAAQGTRVSFIPVPWQVLWAGLKMLESIGLSAAFRSDSLLGLVYANPNPSFELLARLGVRCREFET